MLRAAEVHMFFEMSLSATLRVHFISQTLRTYALCPVVVTTLDPYLNNLTAMENYRWYILASIMTFIVYMALLAAIFSYDNRYQNFSTPELFVFPTMILAIMLIFSLWPVKEINERMGDLYLVIFLVVDIILIAMGKHQVAAYYGLTALIPIAARRMPKMTQSFWAMILTPSPLLLIPAILFRNRPMSGIPFYFAGVLGFLMYFVVNRLTGKGHAL